MTVIDYEQRGAGDWFILSRAIGNFNFELSMGTGRTGRTGSSPNTNNVNGPSGNTANAGTEGDVDLTPASGFGATMMGGGLLSMPFLVLLEQQWLEELPLTVNLQSSPHPMMA